MDHSLEDSLNLESSIGVDFDHSEDTVVNQADITLDGSAHHEESIPMEFEQIEEQPMLMDTGSEEIIVSDFIGDQFSFKSEENVMSSQAEEFDQLQFTSQPISVPASGLNKPIIVPASGLVSEERRLNPRIVGVQTGMPTMRTIAPKKEPVIVTKTTYPRQVSIAPKQIAIAPKPANTSGTIKVTQYGKQYAIAPKQIKPGVKPVALVANRSLNQVAKVTKDAPSGNSVLAIGKQLVMLPPGGAQKIKLVPASSNISSLRLIASNDSEKAQLIPSQKLQEGQNKVVTKIVVPVGTSAGGSLVTSTASESNQPAVLTRVGVDSSGGRSIVHKPAQTTKLSNVILGSPTKAGVRYTSMKKLVTLKPTSTGQVVKKVVLSTNPAQQTIVLSSQTAQPKTTQIPKLTQSVQKTQLHPINVPGKGVQYIRLVTNMTQAKQVLHGPQSLANCPKKIVFADSKGQLGHLVHMAASQPPPLVVTSGASTANIKVSAKPQQKLVKIAPVTTKTIASRGGQSLLAPLSPPHTEVRNNDLSDIMEDINHGQVIEETVQEDSMHLEDVKHVDVQEVEHEEVDSKAALQQLIADTVGSDDDLANYPQKTEYQDNSMGMEASQHGQNEHSLIVIPPAPSTYNIKQDIDDNESFNSSHNYSQNSTSHDESNNSRKMSGMINIEMEPYSNYQTETSPLLQETDNANGADAAGDDGLRRKACNCTKSQCLKLYCDCFASGEFCHACNCTNCHNNLAHEHLRQKAIRGCLDRNPNAFRPKIGKSKTGGQDQFRRHNKGCNCKRSGCLKNYCECYEAKIACTSICRCVGCRNMEESLERARRVPRAPRQPAPPPPPNKQPCSFMTSEVIEAVCQCLIAAAVESEPSAAAEARDPIKNVIDEFSRCLRDIISASSQATPLAVYDEAQT